MTFHRWRKRRLLHGARQTVAQETASPGEATDLASVRPQHELQVDELRSQNERLRRIVTDLLLEKASLQEQVAFLKIDKERVGRH
jgi:hypothetical protein